MELKEYTDNELSYELSRRESEKLDAISKTLPENFLPYEKVDSINVSKGTQIFYAHVDDGCEGHDYLIEYHYDLFESTDNDDDLLYDTIKYAYIKEGEEGGWDARHEGITIEEIGRDSLQLVKIDGKGRFFEE